MAATHSQEPAVPSSATAQRLRVALGASSAPAIARPSQPAIREENHAPNQTDFTTLSQAGPSVLPTATLLLATPLAVALTTVVGCGLLWVLGQGLHPREMTASALVSIVAGLLAVVPMVAALPKPDAMPQAALASIGIRVAVVLGGVVLALGPAWHLQREPLVFWILGYYFPLLAAETGVMAWLFNREP